MRNLFCFAGAVLTLAVGARSQDTITLNNDDVIKCKITSMAGDEIKVVSPVLGELTIKWANVKDITTGEQVILQTKTGDTLPRRIAGIEGDRLVLEGGETSSLARDNLGMINPPEDPVPSWTGSLKLSALQASGNTDRRSVALLFDASRTSTVDRTSVDALWDYGEDKDVNTPGADYTLTQRRAGGGIKYDYFLSKRSYALVTARVLGDTLAQLRLRFTTGAGLGYTMIDDGTTLLLTEVGVSYFSEEYKDGTPSRETVAARVAYRFEHQVSKDTRFRHRVEAFPSTEDIEDTYLQAVTEVSTTLTEGMVASISHIIDYDNTPATGQKRADNRILFSVGWSF